MPSMSAPSSMRKRQRSWTCGSDAALPRTVSPRASDAAIAAFSVAVTLASSRKTFGSDEPVGAHREAPVGLDRRAELLERVQVRVDAAAADHVAARRRRDRAAEAREQRAGEQHRRADAPAELLVELRLRHVRGLDADVVVADPLDVDADVGHQVEHRLHVEDPRHVVKHDEAFGQNTRGQDRQRAVLVAGGADAAVERPRTFDHEGVGERGYDGHGRLS